MADTESARAFDKAASTATLPTYRVFARLASALLPGPEHAVSIADFGSGPARLLILLAQTMPRLTITGSELSPVMLTLARKNILAAGLDDRIEMVEANCIQDIFVPQTPVAPQLSNWESAASGSSDCLADLALSTWLTHHLPDVDAVIRMLRTMDQSTKPDGSLLVIDFLRPPTIELVNMLVRWRASGIEVHDRDYRNSLMAAFDLEEWISIIEKAGIPDLQMVVTAPIPLFIAIYKMGAYACGKPIGKKDLPPYPMEFVQTLGLRFDEWKLMRGFRAGEWGSYNP